MRYSSFVSTVMVASLGFGAAPVRSADPLPEGSVWRCDGLVRYGKSSEPRSLVVTERKDGTFRGLLTHDDGLAAMDRPVAGTVRDGKVEFVENERNPDLSEHPHRKYAGDLRGETIEGKTSRSYTNKEGKRVYFDPVDTFTFKVAKQLSAAELKKRLASYDGALRRAKVEFDEISTRIADPALEKYLLEVVGPSKDGTYGVDFRKFKKGSAVLTRADLAALNPVKRFGVFNLDFTSLADDDLRPLADLEAIRTLYLTESRITGTGLAHLQKLPPLDEINLYGSALTDEGLKVIGRLPSPRRLGIMKTQITDKGLGALAGLKDLRDLHLGHPADRLTPNALAALPELNALETIEFLARSASAESIEALKKFPALKVVRLNGVDPPAFKKLAEVRTFVGLSCLVSKELSDDLLEPFAAMPNLKWFNPGGSYWVPGMDYVDYVQRLAKMSNEEKACYKLVRLLGAISQRDADMAALRRRSISYFPEDTWEENRKVLLGILKTLDDDHLDLQKKVSVVAQSALAYSAQAFPKEVKRAVPVWVTVYVYSGLLEPRLKANLTPKQWDDLQASHRAYRRQSGEFG